MKPSIRSMTGFGQGTAEQNGLRVSVEMKTVNNRFADVRLRLPSEVAGSEAALRRLIQGRVRRGRIEASFTIERPSQEARVELNEALVRGVGEAADRLRSELGVQGELDLSTVLGLPGILEISSGEGEDAAGPLAQQALKAALDALDADRLREGESLRSDLLERAGRMRELAEAAGRRAEELPAGIRTKLAARLGELAKGIELDPARVEQEVVHLIDRADVSEELVRLGGHLEQLARILSKPDGEPVGKRLEFLLQEIHRETNTINSKAADLELSRHALDLKLETEKVREQILNLE
ncbi:hypothetical protein ABI59_04710 [Acidobacteria bacterium Mor1]|nr:hypothetical protein ABI59_04710 [Acidobacteria bacterium Mor1]